MPAVIIVAGFALAGCLLLVLAVARRVLWGPPLRSALAAHDVAPRWARGAAAAALIEVAQVVLGVAGAAAVFGAPIPGALTAVGLLYVVFAGYLTVLLNTKGSVVCGCLGRGERVGAPAIARAGIFAAMSFAARSTPDSTIVALIGVVIACGAVFAVNLLSG
ncbi:hypothetical protein V5P93_003014 [Actinokineospora auranticolor]|nr:MauE/DoxX family redox-associated membrane protein [Actinokineospora auranticolor]